MSKTSTSDRPRLNKGQLWMTHGLMFVWMCLTIGCDEAECTDSGKDADAFVRNLANQQCVTDDDCVVKKTMCATMETSWCGQFIISTEAAASEAWAEIESGLDNCASDCVNCTGALHAACGESGLCYTPRSD